MNERIKGRIVLVMMIAVIIALLSWACAVFTRILENPVGFGDVFWEVFPIALVVYLIWYLAYKFLFNPWIKEFNRCRKIGVDERSSIVEANSKVKFRPPLRMALWLAKNQAHWDEKRAKGGR